MYKSNITKKAMIIKMLNKLLSTKKGRMKIAKLMVPPVRRYLEFKAILGVK